MNLTARSPELIIVDFDLRQRGDVPTEDELTFIKSLEALSVPEDGKIRADLPAIVFAQSLKFPRDGRPGEEFTMRRSILDPLVRASSKLHFASPLFELDDDLIIRHWRSWKTVCDTVPRGRSSSYTSMRLLGCNTAVTSEQEQTPYSNPPRLSPRRFEQRSTRLWCKASSLRPGGSLSLTLRRRSEPLVIQSEDDALSRRILYHFPGDSSPANGDKT